MSLGFLFFVLLLLSFGVLFYLLKPTAMEKAVQRQLADIDERPGTSGEKGTILKDEAIRSNSVLDDLASMVPWMPSIGRLVKQSGNDYRASSVFLLSTGAAL